MIFIFVIFRMFVCCFLVLFLFCLECLLLVWFFVFWGVVFWYWVCVVWLLCMSWVELLGLVLLGWWYRRCLLCFRVSRFLELVVRGRLLEIRSKWRCFVFVDSLLILDLWFYLEYCFFVMRDLVLGFK